MVIVLGYNSSETDFLNSIFEESNIPYKYSLLEPQISRATKIILPHPLNFNSTYRKMHMMNLFSLLRMVKNPILGINDGFHLMCNQLIDSFKCGLGLFQIDIKIGNVSETSIDQVVGKINIISDSILINKELIGKEVNFSLGVQTESCEYSTACINHKNNNYSLTYEHNNHFGVEIDLERNEEISRQIILNYLNL